MPILKNINFKSLQISSVDVGLAEFKVNNSLLASVVRSQLASRRSGTANTKLMSEISGTTAKPYKQKGTGNARHGSKRSVQFRGGRTCFGPLSRSFRYRLPKKIVRNSLLSVIRLKIKEGKFLTFSDCYDSCLKTRNISNALSLNHLNKVLFFYDGKRDDSDKFVKSLRNIKNVKVLDFRAINSYDIIKYDYVAVDSESFETIKNIL